MTEKIIEQLIDKGVRIPNPETVYISSDVDIDRISGNKVTLYSGTKIMGKRSLIMDHAQIGYEAQVTLENTLVGPDSKLNGGYFQDTVLLGKNQFGSNAHVRKGCILEEQANAAHTVGLKQTILFPFVTLGSLINFCDCLMAGGTSRKDHSEVGSSFIHFNYTPNQDKATPSMMGNVHQGVMLNKPPVFLGGQGGLVGPAQIGFGCISAAGSIIRKSEPRENRLILGGGFKNASVPRKAGIYTQPGQILEHNLAYISGLFALKAWYAHIRPLFVSGVHSRELIKGLGENLSLCIKERIKRLVDFGEKLKISRDILGANTKTEKSIVIDSHNRVLEKICLAQDVFDRQDPPFLPGPNGQAFIRSVETAVANQGKDYVRVIQNLDPADGVKGTAWLANIEKKSMDKFYKP
ncbi:MAG: protein GlmU [Desulfobacter sp.]|nr:protein GlmU [Desulfobacter sp.]WDP86222.1 MAG: protein GlmU [Desulfobacter sp.]